jgi:putative ubiquitin-RnfH superfamily antitoxin RatB of RatAB toxin-antitoxin module
MSVEVVCALAPHQVLRLPVQVPAGATALDALRASGLAQQLPAGLLDSLGLGLWGRACAADAVLQPFDRVELTRALTVDPKEARRLRYRRDGVRRKPPPRRA